MNTMLQWNVSFRNEGRHRVRAIVSGADGKSVSRLVSISECQPREDTVVNSKDWHPYKSELFHLFAEVPGEEVACPDRSGDRISIEMDGVEEVVIATDKWISKLGGWCYAIPKPAPLDIVRITDKVTYYDFNGKTVIVSLAD